MPGKATARAASKAERIRVLRVSHASLTPALRERERALVRLHPELELEVITARRWHEGGKMVEAVEDDLCRVTPAATWVRQTVPLFAYDPRPLVAALRRHRPHLIDLHQEPYSISCAETLALCRQFAPQAPVVMFTAQNILKHYPPPFAQWEQWAYRRVAAAYPCSTSVLEVLRAKGFRKPAPVIPFGVDLGAFHFRPPAEASNEPPVIGFIGRMLPAKGLLILADALAAIQELPWRLLLVGDGPEREPMERRLAELGLLDRARFTGAVDYGSVPGYYRQMDVMVMPTQTTKLIREQFGRVLVEAMASGVCVVGSTSGAIPEVIGDAGLVVPEGESAALAAALGRLLTEDGLRGRLAHAGRRRVEEHYTWDRVAEQMRALYRLALGR